MGFKMENGLEEKINRAREEFLINKNPAAARSLLQEVFDEGLTMLNVNPGLSDVLDGAYSLLRKIRCSNNSGIEYKKKYDLFSLAEDTVFCAELLIRERSFLFGSDGAEGFVSVEPRSLAFALSGVIANAVRFSDSDCIAVSQRRSSGSFLISVSAEGNFNVDRFYKAIVSDGSLGFANRLLRANAGGLFLSNGRNTQSVIMKIPSARADLPSVFPLSVEDLLYDRLSEVYTAFCGH